MSRPNFLENPKRHTTTQRSSKTDVDAAYSVEIYDGLGDVDFVWRVIDIVLAVVLVGSIAAIAAGFI